MTSIQIERSALIQGIKVQDAQRLVEDLRDLASNLRKPEHLDTTGKLIEIPPEQLYFLRPKSVYGDSVA